MKFIEDKIGFIGDLHFGKHSDEKWDRVYLNLRDWIIETFKPHTNQLLFFGDVFDGRLTKANEKGATFKSLNFVDKFFEELSKDFTIYVFSGNHDCYYKNGKVGVSGLSLLRNKPNIHVIEDTTDIEHGDKTYRVVPWSCELGNTKVDTIFAHFDIQNFKLNAHKVSDHGYESKTLLGVCDNVFSGHYHHEQDNSYKGGSKRIKYLGTPLQLDWSEAGKESYVYLFDLKEGVITDEFKNDRSPKHMKLFASDLEKRKSEINDNTILDVIWDLEEDIDSTDAKKIIDGCFSSGVNFSQNKEKHFEDIKANISSADPTKIIEEYLGEIEIGEEKKKKVLDRSKKILRMVS